MVRFGQNMATDHGEEVEVWIPIEIILSARGVSVAIISIYGE
jgi:hypothetical protein